MGAACLCSCSALSRAPQPNSSSYPALTAYHSIHATMHPMTSSAYYCQLHRCDILAVSPAQVPPEIWQRKR